MRGCAAAMKTQTNAFASRRMAGDNDATCDRLAANALGCCACQEPVWLSCREPGDGKKARKWKKEEEERSRLLFFIEQGAQDAGDLSFLAQNRIVMLSRTIAGRQAR